MQVIIIVCVAILGHVFYCLGVVLLPCVLVLYFGLWVGDASWDVALESTFVRDVARRRVQGMTS